MAFVGALRGNTPAVLKLGPFLDAANGNDNESGLTILQADVRLAKGNGAFAQKNDTANAVHAELGFFDCPINAADTNTYGRLKVVAHKAGALIVDQDYAVLPEVVYDSMYPAASGDTLPIWGILDWGIAQASAAGNIVHRPGLSAQNDLINGVTELIYAGAGARQSRISHDFDNTSKASSISPDWLVTPDVTSLYVSLASPPAPTNPSVMPTVQLADDGITAAKLATDARQEIQDNILNSIAALNNVSVAQFFTTQMTENYAASGVAPTLAEAIFAIHQHLMNFVISGTTRTVRRLDGTTTAFTETLNAPSNATGLTK